jgi:DNA-binding CsgD family transcriptional regulator/tetratricopeptide (TPR) repeat protein
MTSPLLHGRVLLRSCTRKAAARLRHIPGPAQGSERVGFGTTLERIFERRLAALPEDSRRALLVAAVGAPHELEPTVAALDLLGLNQSLLEAAEDAGLVRMVGERLAFGHPVVRSAVFYASPPSERRAAHRTFARVLADLGNVEGCAWHLAAATLGPDEEVAMALADAAEKARERSGYASAAAALERAARLTPHERLRHERLYAAAEAAWLAGRSESALALLEEALGGCEEPELRARMLHLRGHIERLAGRVMAAYDILVGAAALAVEPAPEAAVAMLADAVEACVFGGAPTKALSAAELARTLVNEDGSLADYLADYALGEALVLSGRAGEGAARLERALAIAEANPVVASNARHLIFASIAALWLERPREGLDFAGRAILLARDQTALGLLAYALEVACWLAFRLGRWDQAYAFGSEALSLGRESSQTTVVVYCLGELALIDAGQGNEARCRTHAAEAIEFAKERGMIITLFAERALALLDLGRGELQQAVRRLEETEGALVALGYYDRDLSPGPDLVEAYVRLGDGDEARRVLERYLAFGARASPAYGATMVARCRGLLADDGEFEALFREALEGGEALDDAFGVARTRLCLGERLRGAGRKIDARRELGPALEFFEAVGAAPWAERSRMELRASGVRLRRRRVREGEELTPQELQIALQVAEGKTNKEVGAALFLSHKTVEYHLRSVYRKLNIHSRGQLIRHLASGSEPRTASESQLRGKNRANESSGGESLS